MSELSKSQMKRIAVMKGESMELKKPREFWIEFGGDPSDDVEVYKRYCARVPFEPTSLSDEVVHCVEKSAYDKLKAENKELRRALEFYAQPTVPDIESVFAKSAAEYGENVVTWEPLVDMGKLARQVLKKYEVK